MKWAGGRTGGQPIDDRRGQAPRTTLTLPEAWQDTMGDFQQFGNVAAGRLGRAVGLLPPLAPGVTDHSLFPESGMQTGILGGLQRYLRR